MKKYTLTFSEVVAKTWNYTATASSEKEAEAKVLAGEWDTEEEGALETWGHEKELIIVEEIPTHEEASR